MIKGTGEDVGLKEMESKQTGGLIERTAKPRTWSSITALRSRRRTVGMYLLGAHTTASAPRTSGFPAQTPQT